MQFKIVYKEKALKDLKRIPEQFKRRIFGIIENLKENPYMGKKLQGEFSGLFSLRVWPYRVIYQINKTEIVVIILHVAHRQGVYKS